MNIINKLNDNGRKVATGFIFVNGRDEFAFKIINLISKLKKYNINNIGI